MHPGANDSLENALRAARELWLEDWDDEPAGLHPDRFPGSRDWPILPGGADENWSPSSVSGDI